MSRNEDNNMVFVLIVTNLGWITANGIYFYLVQCLVGTGKVSLHPPVDVTFLLLKEK